MNSLMMTSAVAAPIISGAAVFLLWRVWLRSIASNWIIAAYVMLLASPLLMLDSVGLEFAVIYSFIFLSLMGWIFVFLSREHKPAKAVKPVSKPATVAKEKNYWRSAQLFLLAGPVALLSAACWTLLLSRLLPIALGEQMVVAAFLMPVAWAVLMAWLCIHRDNRTSNIVNAVVAVLGAVAFYLSPGI